MQETKINVTKFFKPSSKDDGQMKIRIISDPGKRCGYYLVFKNTSTMKRFLKHVINEVIK